MSIRRMSFVGVALVLMAGLTLNSPAQEASASIQVKKFVSLVVGKTMPVEDSPGFYQRVLLSPPDLEGMTPGVSWEISAEAAIKLGNLSEEERWRIIRRNLGLSQEGNKNLILWTEVVNAFFDQLKGLPLEDGAKSPAFGLRVAFPGNNPVPDKRDEPEVALTFNSDLTFDKDAKRDFDSRLADKILTALTGVEVFVNVINEDGSAASSDEAAKVLANLKLHLSDESGKLFIPVYLGQGYFCFSSLPVDPAYPELGSGYRLWAEMGKEFSSGEYEVEIRLSENEEQYVPVRRGARTRWHLTALLKSKDSQSRGIEDLVTGAFFNVVNADIKGVSDLLGVITKRLETNPGLHVGAIQVKDEGLHPLYSVRFHLRAPEQDRQPRFVSRGTFWLQSLSQANPEGTVQPHYIMIVWSGRADQAQLNLQSRPIKTFPLGLTVGIAPSLDPVLYAVGASYKLFSVMELFAGAGIRQDFPTSFVYGLTLDIEKILSVLFGKSKAAD